MTSSETSYRDNVRQKVSTSYSPDVHFLQVFGFTGLCFLASCYFGSLGSFRLLNWVPFCFLLCNFIEYAGHRGPLHHRISVLRFFFKSYSGVHHRFFTSESPTVGKYSDAIFALFPPFAYPIFLLALALPSAPLYFLAGKKVATVHFAVSSLYLLLYEVLHSFHHDALPSTLQSLLDRFSFLQRLKEHHRRHHDWLCLIELSHLTGNLCTNTISISRSQFSTYCLEQCTTAVN